MSQTVMKKEIAEQPELLKALNTRESGVYDALATELRRRRIKSVVIAARGSSDHAGIFGQYLLAKYCGAVVASATPSAITLYGAAPDYSKSLVIGISQSGAGEDVTAVVEAAKACGAVTLAVTNEADSKLAKTAQYLLTCGTEREISVAATKTFTAEMFIMARLAAVWGRCGALKKELAAVGGTLAKNYKELEKRAAELAVRYRFMTDGFTLGRGYMYPIALESALKLKETNYIRMQGAAISDFWHGPLAQADESTPAFVYAMNGPALKSAEELIDRLTEIGAEVCAITDSEELYARRPIGVLIKNRGSDVTAAFCGALFAQLLADALAAERGRNPDAPRALKKVTVTK